MRLTSTLAILVLALLFSANSYAQQPETAAESVDRLKAHLLDVQAQEADRRARLQELDEAIKPENIERSLAGVGSTRPEELREARRRQLAIQRDGVLAQLKLLENSRTRLETAIANAEALAYQQSAQPPTNQTLVANRVRPRFLMIGGVGAVLLALSAGAFLYRRTKRKMIS